MLKDLERMIFTIEKVLKQEKGDKTVFTGPVIVEFEGKSIPPSPKKAGDESLKTPPPVKPATSKN